MSISDLNRSTWFSRPLTVIFTDNTLQLQRPLSLETDIPDHPAFPLYAPSFTLDVPAGYVQDRNSDSYLSEVRFNFDQVIEAIAAVSDDVS